MPFQKSQSRRVKVGQALFNSHFSMAFQGAGAKPVKVSGSRNFLLPPSAFFLLFSHLSWTKGTREPIVRKPYEQRTKA
jgi:hypothetical protein